MAENPRNISGYLIRLPLVHIDQLFNLGENPVLFTAIDGDMVWVSGISMNGFDDSRKIPFAERYRVENGLLFRHNSLIPHASLSKELNWLPFTKSFPVELPSFNHNYFGLRSVLKPELVKSDNEQETFAILTRKKLLSGYIDSCPNIRLKDLGWTIVGEDQQALIMGTPILPLPGQSFWSFEKMLIPSGYTLNFPELSQYLYEIHEVESGKLILWNIDSSYQLLDLAKFEKLTRSSVRLTFPDA